LERRFVVRYVNTPSLENNCIAYSLVSFMPQSSSNQSIEDSESQSALNLRKEVRNLLHAGHDEESVLSTLIKNHGDTVVYSPPIDFQTIWVFGGPFVVAGGILTAAAVLWFGRPSRLDLIKAEAQQSRFFYTSSEAKAILRLLRR
jgi:cytochrome c-type biogenesis protein CcmH/NrfF